MTVSPAVRDRALRALGGDSSIAAALAALPDEWRGSILILARLAGLSPDAQRRVLARVSEPELRQQFRAFLDDHRGATARGILVEGLTDFYGESWLRAKLAAQALRDRPPTEETR